MLEALGVGTDDQEPAAAPATGDVSAAIEAAQSAVGTPYASGGTSLDGFDCSGLTQLGLQEGGHRPAAHEL